MNTALDWQAIEDDLNRHGCAVVPGLLDTGACLALVAQYEQPQRFRSRVVMARHGFGRGEYQYFAYPLPEPVVALRSALYAPLAAIAKRWRAALVDQDLFKVAPAAIDRAQVLQTWLAGKRVFEKK